MLLLAATSTECITVTALLRMCRPEDVLRSLVAMFHCHNVAITPKRNENIRQWNENVQTGTTG